MRSVYSARAALVLVLLAGGAATVAEAQQGAPCDYTSCAIRLRYTGLGDRNIVAGDAAIPITDGGGWSRKVPVLAAGSDSVRFHYVEYRSHAKRAGWVGLLGLVAVGAGIGVDANASDGNKVAAISLISGGFILGIVSSVNESRSEEHLQRAIWLYNRDLGG